MLIGAPTTADAPGDNGARKISVSGGGAAWSSGSSAIATASMRPMTRDCIRVFAMEPAFLADFRDTVDRAVVRLLTMSNEQAAARPAAGKWSPKEIIGHLVDSASNNHGRFV